MQYEVFTPKTKIVQTGNSLRFTTEIPLHWIKPKVKTSNNTSPGKKKGFVMKYAV